MSIRTGLIISAAVASYLFGGMLGVVGLLTGFLGAFSPCPFLDYDTPPLMETAVRATCFMVAQAMGLIVVSLFGLVVGNPDLMFVAEGIEFLKALPFQEMFLYLTLYVLGIVIWVFG